MAVKPAKKIAEKPAVVLKPDDEIKELSNTETPEELTKMIYTLILLKHFLLFLVVSVLGLELSLTNNVINKRFTIFA